MIFNLDVIPTVIEKRPPKQIRDIMQQFFVCEVDVWEQIQAGLFQSVVKQELFYSFYFILQEITRC